MIDIQLMREMLGEIIDQNLLEVSASALSSTIGGSKSFCQRLKDGTAGEKAIQQTWERLKSHYRIDDTTMVCFVLNYREAKEIRRSLEKSLNPKQKNDFLLKTTLLFGSLIYGDERNLPDQTLSSEKWNELIAKRYEQPLNFSEILAILYLMLTKTDSTNVSLRRSLEVSIPGLLRILQGSNDGNINTDVHEMAANYMAEMQIMDNTKTGLLEKVSRPEMLIYAFLCPEFKKAFQGAYYKLPVEGFSYWIDPQTIGSSKPEFYVLLDNITESMPDGGVYNISKIQFQGGEVKVDLCQYLALIEEKGDKGRAVCVTYFREKKKEMTFYDFRYDKDLETIYFTPQGNTEAEGLFPLPKALHHINKGKKKTKEDSQLFHDYLVGRDEEIYSKIEKSIIAYDGISVVEEIEVEDVSVSRRYLTLTLREGDQSNNYRISLREHPTFYNISPGHQVFICKHIGEEKLYAEWAEPHYSLCLDEFEKL